ncbi:MAG: hypothetical protein JWO94_2871, partial [Verrucomicrobiaceae bacterium]|nr:hypothetical protein [Verrucomicrobiaceae bacterium]
VVKYTRSFGFMDLFAADAQTHANPKVELQIPGPAMLPKLLPGQMYYLPETFAH